MKLSLATPNFKTLLPGYKEKLQSDLFGALEALLDKEDVTASIDLILPLTKRRFASAVTYEILGLLYIDQQNFTKSCEALEKAYSFSSKNITVLTYLGVCYAREGKLFDATSYFEKVLRLQNYENKDMVSFLAEFYNNNFAWSKTLELVKLANCQLNTRIYLAEFEALRNLGREKEIIHKINGFDKENFSRDTFATLAESYKKLHDKAKTIEVLKEGLVYFPWDGRLLWMLLGYETELIDTISVETLSEKFLEAMNKGGSDSKEDTFYYSLCLHKVYEGKKDFEKSFSFLETAYPVKLQQTVYRIENDKFLLQKMIALNHLEIKLPQVSSDTAVVFLVGLPNSGTSELGNLLKTVKNSFSGDECPFLSAAINKSDFLNSGLYDDLIMIKDHYFKFLKDAGFSGNFFVDNNPLNFRFLPIIRHAFPHCIIIHTQRDFKQNILSCFLENFTNSSYDFTYDQSILNEYVRLYREANASFKLKQVESEYYFNFDEFKKKPKLVANNLIGFLTTPRSEYCLEDLGDDLFNEFGFVEKLVEEEMQNIEIKHEYYQKYISILTLGL